MGEIVEMMLEGILCQVCGAVFGDMHPDVGADPPGYPRTCRQCKRDEYLDHLAEVNALKRRKSAKGKHP